MHTWRAAAFLVSSWRDVLRPHVMVLTHEYGMIPGINSLLVCMLAGEQATRKAGLSMYLSRQEAACKPETYIHDSATGYGSRIIRSIYKGSAPRAADATRHTRGRNNTTKCKGGGKKRPLVRCNSLRFDNAQT